MSIHEGGAPAAPDPPEKQALDAVFEEIEAITERDAWPRALHFHAI